MMICCLTQFFKSGLRFFKSGLDKWVWINTHVVNQFLYLTDQVMFAICRSRSQRWPGVACGPDGVQCDSCQHRACADSFQARLG